MSVAAEPGLAEILRSVLEAGDLSRALALCEERLRERPEDADAHRHLAQLLAATREFPAALRHARRACELAPGDPRCWSDLGRVFAQDDKPGDAARCFGEAIQVDPRHADAWHNLGTLLKRLKDREGAFKALKHALLLDPTRAETYLNLGGLLIEAEQFEDALECFERAARHDPTLARARSRLACELSSGGKVRRAETLFRESLGLDPDHVQGWLGLGRTLEDLGEAEGARGAYLNVLRRRPDHAQALGLYLALLRRGKDDTGLPLPGDGEAAAWLAHAEQALRSDAVKDEARALIGYGVAKHHDRSGDYRAAAEAGALANAARRRVAGPLDREVLTGRIDNLIGTYTPEFFSERRRWGLGNDQPVFIVGLPRSGTTLTEQIISAHPRLHGAGELPDLARLAVQSLRSGENAEPWRAALDLDLMKSRKLAYDYLRALRGGAPKRMLRISDKSPLNYFQLAFAAVLFPGARVIHCRRDERDNALSIWMENFSPDQRYATDFDDLAFFIAEYRRLMSHWREALPLRVLDVQYEDTVADLEGRARRLIDFLGAPWNDRCLDFHSHDRAVQTPSRWQVRQPIYTRSVHRWRNYADYLPGLNAAFASG